MKPINTQFLTLTIICITLFSYAQEKRDFLSKQLISIEQPITTSTTFFTTKQEITKQLKELSPTQKETIIRKAKTASSYSWPSIPATTYLEFKRTGNRDIMQKYQNEKKKNLQNLILAELLENKGEYLDAIINGSWSLCEQTTWVLSAHLASQKGGAGIPNIEEPIIDLGAGEVSSLLAWTYHFFKEDFKETSPFLYNRIPLEIKNRIINPYLTRNDFWWMAFKKETFVNNWNPWCNYNTLLSTLLLQDQVSEENKSEVLIKSLKSVDKFINYYKADGACEEGPSYWSHAGGKMLEYLELVFNATDGKISLRDNDLVQKMGTYIMDANIENDYYVNFSDASVRANPNPGIIYRYGVYTKDKALKQFAAYLANENSFYENMTHHAIDQIINNLKIKEDLKATTPEKINNLSFEYLETGIIGGRTSKEKNEGFFFAAKGGYNDESHNHNDAGSFILYYKGKPLIADIGVETYSKKTFSKQRYEIWTMQSNFHNLPMINGVPQSYGHEYKATNTSFKDSRSKLNYNLNINKAYPEEAYCESFKRKYTLQRGSNPKLYVTDSYQLKEYRDPTVEHFITASKPDLIKDGEIKLDNNVLLQYPQNTFEVSIETLHLKDKKLLNSWQQDQLYRIKLISTDTSLTNNWNFIISEI